MDIKDTKTAENLRKALAGESIARNKYTYFAMAARDSGDEEIAAAFEQMANNEMTHAKFWFELLNGKPTDTRECLTQAAMGEYSEWHDMYPGFAAQARAEGLEDIAVMFEKVAAIERGHESRFMTLLAKLSQTAPEQAPAHVQDETVPREKKPVTAASSAARYLRNAPMSATCVRPSAPLRWPSITNRRTENPGSFLGCRG